MIDVAVMAAGSTLDATVCDLAAHGIAHALIAAQSGATYRVRVANDFALASAGTRNGVTLHPLATLNPVEYLDWPTELERVLVAGAVALRFFPEQQKWGVASQAFRDMARAVRGRCPLLVPVTRFGDASVIGEATQQADAPVILLGAHYTQLGGCLAALKRWPHLYLETSSLGQFRGVATVVREVSAERLLFGSGAPTRPIQAPLNAVLTACVSETEQRAILADNAARLFGLRSGASPLPAPWTGTDLVDVHAHVGALAFPTPEIDDHAAMARQHGIARSVASSLRAIADDADLGNGNAECFAAGNDALLAYVVVDPRHMDQSCAAMDAAYGKDLAVGAKIHCTWSHSPTASRACTDLVREVARRGRPLLIHVDGRDWSDALGEVADAFPDWNLIVAHAGPGTPVLETANLIGHTSNVYAELATSFPDRDTVRNVVQRIGPERLLFGSDAPLLDPAYVQGVYTDAHADFTRTAALAREVFGL